AAPADAPALVAGITLGLIAGITYALYSWAAARLMTDGIERAAAMGWVFGIGGLLLVPVLLITGAPLLSSPQTVAVAAYMALVPMFLGYVLFGWGLARLGPSTATTITLIEPAVATMLAVLVVGERLSPVGWVGLALIALVVVVLACAPEAPHEERD
ncbi:MAG: EamA family transporter, partial [Microbacterium sp.]|nr:EamA family transporter [Microbacterium sp.]